MDHLRSPDFDWGSESILRAPPELKLTTRGHCYSMFKYVKAMQEAVEMGVTTKDDLTPTSPIQRLRNMKLETVLQERRGNMKARNDIEDPSCSLKALPNESPEEHLSRLCLIRNYNSDLNANGTIKIPAFIDVTPEHLTLLQPTTEQLSAGALLKEANKHTGRRMGLRRLNFIGEVPGLCRVTNTNKRVENILHAMKMSNTMESLLLAKKKARLASQEGKIHQRSKLASLMGVPVPSKDFTAVQLKNFISDRLGGSYPSVAKKTTLAGSALFAHGEIQT